MEVIRVKKEQKALEFVKAKQAAIAESKETLVRRQQVEQREQKQKTAHEARLQKMTENESVCRCLQCKLEESLITLTTTKEKSGGRKRANKLRQHFGRHI